MIQSARDRLAGVLSRRVQSQVVRAERIRARTASTVYAGQNRVQPLGAETSVRPRGLQTNSGLSIGSPIQFNQGLAASTPRLGNGDGSIGAALEAANERNAGFQRGEDNPNTSGLRARYPNDGYVQTDGSDNILALWIWDATNQVWVEFAGGGVTILMGDGPPPQSLGSLNNLYVDVGYEGGATVPGVEALQWYIKLNDYPTTTKPQWYPIGPRAVLGAPTVNGLHNGQLHITRDGTVYAWWDGVWRRRNRITTGPAPPDIKQVGDIHVITQELTGPPASEIECAYKYNGMGWALVGCCADCDPSPPPEEPYPEDYDVSCTGGANDGDDGFKPNRPYPDGSGGYICTINPVI
ncbi:MAG: hypothetical protein AAF215_05120 [Cyanobacteria bacterium P01_A01_bin.123]